MKVNILLSNHLGKYFFDVDLITTSMTIPITQQLTHQIYVNDNSFFVELHGVSFAPQTSACDNETFHDLLGMHANK